MITFLVCALLVSATIAIHYESLRFASSKIAHFRIPPRTRIIVILAAALFSHIAQIFLYAVSYLVIEEIGGLGSIGGVRGHDLGDAFYFSISSYTTLGIGDLYPTGVLRLISGVEALNGLVMVGWSASMTYLYMEKFWHLKGRSPRKKR